MRCVEHRSSAVAPPEGARNYLASTTSPALNGGLQYDGIHCRSVPILSMLLSMLLRTSGWYAYGMRCSALGEGPQFGLQLRHARAGVHDAVDASGGAILQADGSVAPSAASARAAGAVPAARPSPPLFGGPSRSPVLGTRPPSALAALHVRIAIHTDVA